MSGSGGKAKATATTSQKAKTTNGRQSRNTASETQAQGKTRATGTVELDDEEQEISTPERGKAYLEEKLLLVPHGAPLTLDALSTTLFQVAALPGVGKPAIDAVRAVAYLLREIEIGESAEVIRDIANAQFNELTKDLKEFTEGLRETVMAELDKKTVELGEVAEKVAQQAGNTGNTPYRDALGRAAPLDVNPRLVAKEGIRMRQSLIDLPKGSSLRNCTNLVLVGKLSEAMGRATAQRHKLRSALRLQNGGVLVEMATDEGAAWLATTSNAEAFLQELGESTASFKTRSYNVIAYYVPLSLDTNSEKDRREIEETNNIPKGELLKIRWVKPPMRRRVDQRFGHAIAIFSSADSANRAIVNGLSICHKRVSVAKCKKEPIRCLKCQGYDHVASECLLTSKEVNICGTCGARDHWTSKCVQQGVTHCTACSADDHTSWDRNCPTFLRKIEELNARDPANDIPFFPSREPWTWTPDYPSQGRYVHPTEIQINSSQAGSQKERYKQTQLNFVATAPGGRPYTRESWSRPRSTPPTTKSPPPAFPNPESPIAPTASPAAGSGSTLTDSSSPQVVAHV